MPTIKQLPAATSVSASDVIPVSQGGTTRSLSIGGLLSSTQAAISLASGKLLGRVSASAGGPEPVNIGTGLTLSAGTLAATGDDHRYLPVSTRISSTDEVIVNSDNAARRMPAAMFRGLFTAGSGISIDPDGLISALGGGGSGSAGPGAIATTNTVGLVKPGPGLSISSNGTLSTDGSFIASQLATGPGLGVANGSLAIVDGSAIPVRIAGGLATRTLAARAADRLNVRDFGTVGDGIVSDGDSLSACALAGFYAGKDVYVPAGTYRITGANPFILRPGVAVYCDQRAVLLCDSSASGPADLITNVGVAGDYSIFGGTLKGMADTIPTEGAHNISIYNADSVVLDGVTSRYSRKFGFAVINCKRAMVRGCTMHRSVADGIAVWDTSEFQITGCDVQGANDDGISAHSSEVYPLPRSGGLIANNTLSDTQGISVLGPKALTITGNVLRRIMGHGIVVGAYPPAKQGDTAGFGVRITNNMICDVFRRPEPTPRNADQGYVILLLNSRQAGNGASAPGDPAPDSGIVTSLLGSGTGTLYSQTITGPLPGNFWFDVSGNTLVRTLPSSAAWGAWGYGSELWIGDNGANGTFTGGVPEANLNTNGIAITGTLRNSRIADNIIDTTGANCIWFTNNSPISSGDYDGLEIVRNKFVNYSSAGIYWDATATTSHQMRVVSNTFNADPQFKSINRIPGGGWGADSLPVGVCGSCLNGVAYEGNHFRNLVRPVSPGGSKSLFSANVVFGNCSSFGVVDPANTGVLVPPLPGLGWQYCQEDSDPRSRSFGQALSQPSMTVPVVEGGTGAASAADARANLGLGSAAILGVGTVANTVAAGDDARIAGAVQKSANLADLTNLGAARANLGFASVAISGAYADLSGQPGIPAAGSATPQISGVASSGTSGLYARQDHVHPVDVSRAAVSSNLSDLLDIAAARRNLGLGGSAVLDIGTSAATVAAGDDSRFADGAKKSANLADIADPGLARVNINRGAVTLASSASIATDCRVGSVFVLVLSTNATLLNPTRLVAGASYLWKITQDSVGGRTLSYSAAFKWPGGVTPTLSTASGAIDIISAITDGTAIYAVLSKSFG